MNTEDERGPRSTEEANVALRADAANRLLADPDSMPQPWNESRPAGWPVAEAVFAFTHESVRPQVSLHLGLAAEGYVDPDRSERLSLYGWHYVRQRLSKGELTATGIIIIEGVTDPRPLPLPASLFDQATFTPDTGLVLAVGRTYGGVRIFETKPEGALVEKDQYRSGGSGRPSPVPLARVRMRIRHAAGQMLSGLIAECTALVNWLESEHPDAPSIKPKSLSEQLRAEHRELRQKP